VTKIIRSRDLSVAELCEDDLESRAIVVEGYVKGEVLPPYESPIDEKVGDEILHYLKGKQFYTGPDSIHIMNHSGSDPPQVIEITGAELAICVRAAAHQALRDGHPVFINPERIMYTRSEFGRFWRGKLLLQYIFTDTPDAKCLIYGKDFIFFKEDSDPS